jgi:hypothetical protein
MFDWMRELAWELIKLLVDFHMTEKHLNFLPGGVNSRTWSGVFSESDLAFSFFSCNLGGKLCRIG